MTQLATLYNPAPRRRRKTTAKRHASPRQKTTTRRRRANPMARRKTRRMTRRRRNPARRMNLNTILRTQVQPAAIQASGAILLDVAFGYIGGMLPAALSTGNMRHVTKGIGAIALSMVASMFTKAATANDMAKGALTVTMHDAAKDLIATMAPQIPLGSMGYFNTGYTYPGLSNAIVSSYDNNLGYFQPANNNVGVDTINSDFSEI